MSPGRPFNTCKILFVRLVENAKTNVEMAWKLKKVLFMFIFAREQSFFINKENPTELILRQRYSDLHGYDNSEIHL